MNEANELDYAAIFDEPTADVSEDGNTETEQTEASESETVIDDNGTTEPVSGSDVGTVDEGNGEQTGERTDTVERPPQSPEENARYAAARRDAERQRDEAIAAEREKHAQEMSMLFARLGIRNPYNNTTIKNMEEYKAFQEQNERVQRQEMMKRMGLGEAEYASFVDSLPEVRAARAAAEQARIAERQAADSKSKAVFDEQLKQIGELDPQIRSASDLMKDPSYPAVYDYVKRGYKLIDAYRIANFDKLTTRATDAARQRVINEQAGKEHLMQTTQRGSGIDMVPADVKEQFRMMMPEMSDAEIAKAYARHVNQTRK